VKATVFAKGLLEGAIRAILSGCTSLARSAFYFSLSAPLAMRSSMISV